jgi:hypothetical protein
MPQLHDSGSRLPRRRISSTSIWISAAALSTIARSSFPSLLSLLGLPHTIPRPFTSHHLHRSLLRPRLDSLAPCPPRKTDIVAETVHSCNWGIFVMALPAPRPAGPVSTTTLYRLLGTPAAPTQPAHTGLTGLPGSITRPMCSPGTHRWNRRLANISGRRKNNRSSVTGIFHFIYQWREGTKAQCAH